MGGHIIKVIKMSVENNKKLIETYFSTVESLDEQKIASLLSEDFLFESMLKKPEIFNFSWGRSHFSAAAKAMSARMKAPLKFWIVDMIGEGDKVAVQAESMGEMLSGKIYNNAYHFLFTIHDGKITHVKEYSCSFTANDCFGEFGSADKGLAGQP